MNKARQEFKQKQRKMKKEKKKKIKNYILEMRIGSMFNKNLHNFFKTILSS